MRSGANLCVDIPTTLTAGKSTTWDSKESPTLATKLDKEVSDLKVAIGAGESKINELLIQDQSRGVS